MSSDRLKKVYGSRIWRAMRLRVIERAGFQCEYRYTNVFGEETRCTEMDKKAGGRESLTVNHTEPYGDPYDEEKQEALCRRHHGMVDGGRATRSGEW